MGYLGNSKEAQLAAGIAQELGIKTLIDEMQAHRTIPVELRREIEAKRKELREHRQGALLYAKDNLQIADAALLLEVNEAKDEKDKPRYSNEAMRSAALVIARGNDPNYKEALNALREAEQRDQELADAIQDLEGKIKTEAEFGWSCRAESELLAAIVNMAAALHSTGGTR